MKSKEGVGCDLITFTEQQREWSSDTFGPIEVRGPLGPVKHLAKEVLVELLGVPKGAVRSVLEGVVKVHAPILDDIEEYADLLFLLNDALWRAGFTWEQLTEAAFAKLEKNKARDFGSWKDWVFEEPEPWSNHDNSLAGWICRWSNPKKEGQHGSHGYAFTTSGPEEARKKAYAAVFGEAVEHDRSKD